VDAGSEKTNSPYRGEDRRQRGGQDGRQLWMSSMVALALILLLGLSINIGPVIASGSGAVDTMVLDSLLDAAALAITVLISVLCYVRWRLSGQAAALWLAAAAGTYGILTIGTGHILPVILTGGGLDVIAWLHPASRLVVIGLFVMALRAPDVSAPLTVRATMTTTVAATAMVTVGFQLMPPLGAALSGAHDQVSEGGFGSLLLITVLCALGAAFIVRGVRSSRHLLPWFGVMLVGLALVEVHRFLPFTEVGVWVFGDGMLRLAAVTVAAFGVTRDLLLTFGEQSGHLLQSVTSGMTAEARIRAEQAAKEERAHEARNALTAIEGATRTLERYRDRLDPATRESLAAAITGEVARLQQLVSVEWVRNERQMFNLVSSLSSVIATAKAHGMEIVVDIDPELQAYGRGPEVAEVVQNLLENARRYAASSPVLVRAEHDEEHILVRVEDRGPGVPTHERRSIFDRGVRGSTSTPIDGSGLGLFVSAKLMREQDGDLWVEGRPGGGSSFIVKLPGSAPDARAAAIDEEHAAQE
jgi:signal transduction histidine kinase